MNIHGDLCLKQRACWIRSTFRHQDSHHPSTEENQLEAEQRFAATDLGNLCTGIGSKPFEVGM